MRLEARKYLYDIQHAAALLMEFTTGKTFVDCERDANAGHPEELAIGGDLCGMRCYRNSCRVKSAFVMPRKWWRASNDPHRYQ